MEDEEFKEDALEPVEDPDLDEEIDEDLPLASKKKKDLIDTDTESLDDLKDEEDEEWEADVDEEE